MSSAPPTAIAAWGKAAECCLDIESALDAELAVLNIEVVRKSAKSLASGLWAWQAFAVALGYPPEETLMPRRERHACNFLLMFRHPRTAINYMEHVAHAVACAPALH